MVPNEAPAMREAWYTPDQVAAELRVTRAWVYQLIGRRLIPASKFGERWRVEAGDLRTFKLIAKPPGRRRADLRKLRAA